MNYLHRVFSFLPFSGQLLINWLEVNSLNLRLLTLSRFTSQTLSGLLRFQPRVTLCKLSTSWMTFTPASTVSLNITRYIKWKQLEMHTWLSLDFLIRMETSMPDKLLQWLFISCLRYKPLRFVIDQERDWSWELEFILDPALLES